MINILQENLVNIKKSAKKSGVMAIYVFGSYAKAQASESSDLDLLLITDDKANTDDISTLFSLQLFPRNYDLDLLSYRRSDILKKKENNHFFQTIIKEGKLIYGTNLF